MDIEFDNILSNEDVKDYKLFIEKLRQLKEKGCSTKDILFIIYQYFKDYVTFNYDQLQLEKILGIEQNESNQLVYKCAQIYKKINDRIKEINLISAQTQLTPKEIIDNDIAEEPYPKERAIELLDDVFLKAEGRKLTNRNKDMIFKNYGNEVHISYKSAKKTEIHKTDEILAHEEIYGLNIEQYKPVYCNNMLIDGVSSEYKSFIRKICKDLRIKYMEIEGVETTQHSWNMIYLPEEQRWVHFDMAMVKFYQDEWIKEHDPYNMEDWVAASTGDIFKMQPTRKITKINGIKCLYNKDNYSNLDIKKYDVEEIRE